MPQVFAGQVKGERDGGWMEVEVKNRIEVGDEVEYISPTGQRYFKIEAIENKKGESVSVAHGGNGCVWIPSPGSIDPYALLSLVKADKPVSV